MVKYLLEEVKYWINRKLLPTTHKKGKGEIQKIFKTDIPSALLQCEVQESSFHFVLLKYLFDFLLLTSEKVS